VTQTGLSLTEIATSCYMMVKLRPFFMLQQYNIKQHIITQDVVKQINLTHIKKSKHNDTQQNLRRQNTTLYIAFITDKRWNEVITENVILTLEDACEDV